MKKINYCAMALIFALTCSGCSSRLQNLQEQADNGDANSQLELAMTYYQGADGVQQDEQLAIKYLTLSAEKNNIDAVYTLARILEKKGEYKKAVKYYEIASEQNHAYSQLNLGIMYKTGRGVEKDLNKAEELYKQAYANGDLYGMRNLAILYKEEKQYQKAEDAFRQIIFAETGKGNSYAFKQFSCLELMNMNNENKSYEKAYTWGATAILSGVFDSKVENAEEYLKTFETLSNGLINAKKEKLSKTILENHYKIFQQYEYYFANHSEIKSDDGVVILSTKELVGLTGYLVSKNESLHKRASYWKQSTDMDAKLNLAIQKLKLASTYIKLGAIVPEYGLAISNIEEANTLLEQYDYKSLDLLENSINKKLVILKDVYKYQSIQHDLKQARNNAAKKQMNS